jgi:hypothetical protein
MATGTLEERLAVVDAELVQLKQRLDQNILPMTNPWLDQIFGVFKNDPLFEEAVRCGREWREAQQMRQGKIRSDSDDR